MSQEASASAGEFEREPVPDSASRDSEEFGGMCADERAAGTEFMMRPLFLAAGESLSDSIRSLLRRSFFAVLAGRFLVGSIARSKRLTLYDQRERISGDSLVRFYNIVNGLLFGFLAGAMVAVDTSAVAVPFGITFDVPESRFAVSNLTVTSLVAIVGVVIAVAAAGRSARGSRVANIAAPWVIVVPAACGVVSLAQMKASSMLTLPEGTFWAAAIAFVQEGIGPRAFPFGQIVVFAAYVVIPCWIACGAFSLFLSKFTQYESIGNGPTSSAKHTRNFA